MTIYDPISEALNMRPIEFNYVIPQENIIPFKVSSPNKGGYFLSEETKNNMRKPKSEQHAKNISLGQKGISVPTRGNPVGTKRPGIGGVPKGTLPWNTNKCHPEETRIKIREKALAREKHKCPHCGILSSPSNAKRWHFDNCKKKNHDTILENP